MLRLLPKNREKSDARTIEIKKEFIPDTVKVFVIYREDGKQTDLSAHGIRWETHMDRNLSNLEARLFATGAQEINCGYGILYEKVSDQASADKLGVYRHLEYKHK